MKELKIVIHVIGCLMIFGAFGYPYLNELPTWLHIMYYFIASFTIYPFIIKFHKEK